MERKKHVSWGFENEERFFRAFAEEGWQKPEWFLEVRRPTIQQDRREGIDAFIVTKETGAIPLQIKSSVHGMIKFRKKHPRNQAVVVIVRAGLSPGAIRRHVLAAVQKRRE